MRVSDKTLVTEATLSLLLILVLATAIFFLSQPQTLTVLGISTEYSN